ncbi:putative SOS response-associated peptidase YedK [Sphingomonas sp. F9_3S_D5_B_2]
MCNLYKMTKTVDEVARLFDAIADPAGNAGDTVYPGYPGIVVAPDGGAGLRVRQMSWGFPLTLKGKNGQPLRPKPVNNCRTDKLDSFMWRHSFRERRCLIPVTAFCEAEGEKGAKTRTWFSLPGEELFVVAGIWRDTAEWGPAYSMVMTEACEHVVGVHDRMPAILPRSAWTDWLDGPPDAAGLLCRPWELGMTVERTEEAWVRR